MSSLRVDDFAIQALVDDELTDDEWMRVVLYLTHNPAAMGRYRQLRHERELLARLGTPGGDPQGARPKQNTCETPAPAGTSSRVRDSGRSNDKAGRSSLPRQYRCVQEGRKRAR